MKKTFDAVLMVRQIRDKMHNKTKRMTFEQKMEFYRQQSQELHAELDRSHSFAVAH